MNPEVRGGSKMNALQPRVLNGVLFLIVAGLVAVQSSAAGQEVEGKPGEGGALCAEVKIRVCVLPFLLPGSYESRRQDLAPLLEAHLAACPYVDVAPAKVFRERQEDVDLLWGKGAWKEGSEQRRAEVYFGMRDRWLERAGGCLASDFVAWGRVISTGEKRSLLVEVFRKTTPSEILFSAVESTDGDGEIPQGLLRISQHVCGYLEGEWSGLCMEEIRGQYLGRLCSLEAAVQAGGELVQAYPEALRLRVELLSLCKEAEVDYHREIVEQAAWIVRLLKSGDREVTALFAQLNVDPFEILCRDQADRGDWSGVLETSRLGLDKNAIQTRTYRVWRTRALLELGKLEEAMQEVTRLLRESPQDGEGIRLRLEIEGRLSSRGRTLEAP